MPFWNVNSTTLANNEMYVNNTYKNVDGNNALTTITATNNVGYIPVDSTSTDPIVKNLEFAIRKDGKITYRISNSPRVYNSIQQIASAGFPNYNKSTTDKIKDSMQRNLTSRVESYNQQNSNQPIGPRTSPREPTQNEIDVASIEQALEKARPIVLDQISANARRDYGPPLYYPTDLEKNGQDRITFTMKRLTGSKINSNSFDSNARVVDRRNVDNIKGSVTLPIQSGITDSNSVDWSGATLNAIQARGAAAGMQLIGSENGAQLANNAADLLGKIVQEITSKGLYQDAFKVYFAQEAVSTQNLLSRATGATLNPNLELLFNGPSLRPFNFTFRLSPRDEPEARRVRKIIRFFKQGMSVKTTPSNVFLQSPNVFDIRYQTFDDNGVLIEHPSINRIKRCALLSCDVDYTPDGTYMTYNEPQRSMTSYQLSLRFSELDPIYEDDYGGAGGSGTTETTRERPLATDEIGY